MGRPFTRAQAIENRRFVEILGETGNARLAARSIGRRHSTMHHRRKACAAFAQDWEAAVAAAHARFHLAGGRRGPEGVGASTGAGRKGGGASAPGGFTPPPPFGWSPSPSKLGEDLRTRGGEAVVVRSQNGKLQLRFAHKDKLTKATEQAFLRALSATCNVRLSAAAAGASQAAFYRRRRQDKAFAREWRLALEMGYRRLLCAMVQAGLPESHAHDGWRHNDPPPIPPLTADQALQLLWLHQKSVELGWERPHRRRRRGEPWDVHGERLRAMWAAEQRHAAEDEAVARALRFEESGDWRFEDEPPPPPLPPLPLVTGWSKASGRPPHHEGVPLFGGWRIEDMEKKLAGG